MIPLICSAFTRRSSSTLLYKICLTVWNKYALIQEALPRPSSAPLIVETPDAGFKLYEEWDWLKKTYSDHITDLESSTKKILDLIQGVGQQYNTELVLLPGAGLPDLAVHPVAFRQILLNLLQVAIHQAEGGKVFLELSSHPPFGEFHVRSEPVAVHSDGSHQAQDANLVKFATHLTDLCGGRLVIPQHPDRFECQLSLPAVEGLQVLVIDDNLEIIELLQRYTDGTRYTVLGSTDPEKAIELAEANSAQIIVIDVMMPKIDGWELLGRLRNHPQTAGIPVIVLSILAQEDLAYSLGAQKLIMKPVSQEVFLSALDEILANQSSSPH